MRYIVFCLDSRFKTPEHSGMIFPTLDQARRFIEENLEDDYADKFVIASFLREYIDYEYCQLHQVETMGFLRSATKKSNQLKIFN